MSIIYCEPCDTYHDTDKVECVEGQDGEIVCFDCLFSDDHVKGSLTSAIALLIILVISFAGPFL